MNGCFNTIVIGSGAAGLSAAVRLHSHGVENIAIFTEGMKMGTSINTGSDKQTYYKLGVCGDQPDCPADMARDLAAGGSMHGDIALVEAAMSAQTFFNLLNIGVPFPHDRFGQATGYKTDHDPRRRATSCGPYTSKEMCCKLISEVKRRNIPVFENRNVIKLITLEKPKRVCGAVFVDSKTGEFETVQAENVIFAVGGPGGLYSASVYPKVHTGAIGVALEAGAKAANLAESQFGLASTKFRWNVSGSYMQVLPKFISTDADGNDPKEFLREYFDSASEMYDAIFLKGYQWPFATGHVPGSSLIDIYTYIECIERKRRVFLDYRSDPEDLDINTLAEETFSYLKNSGAVADSPLARLQIMNMPAFDLYRTHGINLAEEMLEIAVCAQHNNGGLAGNIWWESINIRHLFPIGEVNGSHGVTRPGGSALNSGQAGAFRAAEFIAAKYQTKSVNDDEFAAEAEKINAFYRSLRSVPSQTDWKHERNEIQLRMSSAGAFIRETQTVTDALDGAYQQYARLAADGIGGLDPKELCENLRNRHLCTAQIFYLESILMQIDYIGSRGGSMVLSSEGEKISPKLPDKWRIKPEAEEYRNYIMFAAYADNGYPEISFDKCRKIPVEDNWFENVWHDFRSGTIYNGEKNDL